MTTNKPMTGEQLDELMTVAVNMQRDSEKAGERSVAMFAYAVQVAVLELRKVREIKPADEDYVAAMNSITAIIAILGLSDTLGISEQVAELKAQRDALAAENAGLKKFCEDAAFYADYEAELGMERGGFTDGLSLVKTPATDAFLAEVRAQGVEMFAEIQKEYVRNNRKELDSMTRAAYCGSAVDAERFAAQLRKGVQS